jgi:hypothetical protein
MLKKEIWPYNVPIELTGTDSKIIEIEAWLEETLGEHKNKWVALYRFGETHFHFREEKDAAWFTLRWT